MRKLLLLITGLLLLFSVDGQILRYSNYTAPTPPTVLVESISVWGTGGATTISTNGGTLQMLKKTLPTNAADTTVTWSRINGTGTADISAGGLLTALTNGTVTARATANDGSAVYGEEEITISNQEVTAPSFLTSDEHTEVWLIDDEENMTKDASHLVTVWEDLSTNGFDFTNSGGGQRPTWSSSGVTFTTGNVLYNSSMNIAQPWVVYLVFRQVSVTEFHDIISLDADINSHIMQRPDRLQFVANGVYNNVTGLGTTDLGLAIMRLNGASSKAQLNDGDPVTFNGGTDPINDVILNNFDYGATIIIRELIIRSVADDSTNEAAILNYLMSKYGIQ